MLTRLPLNIICAYYRYTGEVHACAKHGECHSTIWQESCADFQGIVRARSTEKAPVIFRSRKVIVEDEFAEHCPCAR